MEKKIIAIGCDHAGYPYKAAIVDLLTALEYSVEDFGANAADAVDYPDFAHPVALKVVSGEAWRGVLLCGSGNGVAMTANKHQHIRAAVCWLPELATLARMHNDANVITLPVLFITEETAVACIKAFLEADFEGGRHARRVGKIACP